MGFDRFDLIMGQPENLQSCSLIRFLPFFLQAGNFGRPHSELSENGNHISLRAGHDGGLGNWIRDRRAQYRPFF